MSEPPPLHGPRKRDIWRTLALPWEVRGLPRAFARVQPRVTTAPPVTVIPGLYAGDGTMTLMRSYLRRAGFDVRGWGLGFNRAGAETKSPLSTLPAHWNVPDGQVDSGEGEVPHLVERMAEVIRARAREHNRPIALVGWSLGGYIAREIARDNPDVVSAVVTLGTPIIGGPKYTLAAGRYQRRGYDLDWLERVTVRRHDRPIACPVSVIYSKVDAIIGWPAAYDRFTPQARHFEVNCAHTAFGYHPRVFEIIASELELNLG